MKARPILFGAPMVRAILAGRKTQTRRAITAPWLAQVDIDMIGFTALTPPGHVSVRGRFPSGEFGDKHLKCPFGAKGDQLYVREEYFAFGHWEPVTGDKSRTRAGRQRWQFVEDSDEVRYLDKAPDSYRKGRHHEDPETPAWHKRLARFMPKKRVRIWLELVDFRVERLAKISTADAGAEGMCFLAAENFDAVLPSGPRKGIRVIQQHHWPEENYTRYWELLHGEYDPATWVWVVDFKRIPWEGE